MIITEEKTKSRGISIFPTAIVILLIGTIFISVYIYFIYQQSAQRIVKIEEEFARELDFYQSSYNRVTKFLLYKLYNIAEPDRPKFEIVLVGVANFSTEDFDTKAIVFKNVGNSIMTDFKVLFEGRELITYYKPRAVFPDENGVVILWPFQVQEWQLKKSEIEIKSEGMSIKVKS